MRPNTSLTVRIAVAWLLLCVSASVVQAANPEAAALLDTADRLQRNDPKAAIEVSREALQSLSANPDTMQMLRARAMLCDALSETNREQALEHFDAGMALATTPELLAWQATLMTCRGAIEEAQGNIDAAAGDYDKAVSIAESQHQQMFLAEALFSRGHLRSLATSDASALMDFERAQTIFTSLGKLEHARTVTNSIATLFNRAGDYARAREYLMLSVNHLSGQQMPRDLGVVLQNLGRILENLDDLDGAMDAYQRSLAAQQQVDYDRGIAYARRGLASVYNTRKQPEQALDQIAAVDAILPGIDDARLPPQIALQRGRALLQLKRYAAAEVALKNAIDGFRSLRQSPELRDSYQYQADVLEQTGRWQEALAQHREFKRLSDRILNDQRQQLIEIQKSQFTAKLDAQQLQTLSSEKAMADRELQQQNQLSRLQWILLALSIIAAVAAALAFKGERGRFRIKTAAEAMLLERDTHRQRFLNSAKDAVIEMNAAGEVTEWNQQAETVFGWSRDEAIGQKVSELIIPPEFWERHYSGLQRHAQGASRGSLNRSIDVEALTRDGRRIAVEMSLWSFKIGNDLAFGAFLRDITQRRQVELAMRQSEERYRHVVEHVGEGMLVVQDGKIVYANPRALTLSGYSMAELAASSFVNQIHPDDRPKVVDLHTRRVRGESVESGYEVRFIHKLGEVRWLSMGVTLVPWDGRTATLTFVVDITERKMLEEVLKNTLHEREAILDNSLIGMAYVTDQHRISWTNSKLAAMLDVPHDQLAGRAMTEFFADTALIAAFETDSTRAIAEDGLYVGEVALRRQDGGSFWVLLSASSLDREKPGHGELWALLDVTDRHHAEQEIRDALVRQRELNDLKSRFVSMTSHEFRTPLATILSATELLRHYHDRLPDSEKVEMFDSIEIAIKRMTQMLDNVLLLGKIDSRMLRFEPKPTDARKLCSDIADEIRQAHHQTPCVLNTEFDLSDDPMELDERLFRHIFVNLISNAYKYSPAGGSIDFRIRRLERELHASVADRGIGIPAEDLARLFEAFHRAANVGNIPGTGLGLSIVKQAAELHGGTIGVVSEVGKGTTFTVRLNIAQG